MVYKTTHGLQFLGRGFNKILLNSHIKQEIYKSSLTILNN